MFIDENWTATPFLLLMIKIINQFLKICNSSAVFKLLFVTAYKIGKLQLGKMSCGLVFALFGLVEIKLEHWCETPELVASSQKKTKVN